MYGNPRKQRSLSRNNDDDTKKFLDYYHKIKSGELNINNTSLELITKIHDLACKLNGGDSPKEIALLYYTIKENEHE